MGIAATYQPWNVVSSTTTITAKSGDLQLANATTAGFTITLPSPTINSRVRVIKTDSSANIVTVTTPSGSIFAGASVGITSAKLNKQGSSFEILADGTNWYAINFFLPTLVFKPSNPGSTTSTAGLMMGMGSTISYTPQLTGIIEITLNGVGRTATGLTTWTFTPKISAVANQAAPSNGGAIVGNSWGIGVAMESTAVGTFTSYTAGDKVTGLTVGSSYWVDVVLATGNSSDAASILANYCFITETG